MYLFFRLTTIIFCFAAASVVAQDHKKFDSLKKVLTSAKGVDRFIPLNELFKQTDDSNIALDFADSFYDLAVSLGDSVRMVQGGRMRAYSLMDLGRNEEGADILAKILGIAKRNQAHYPELEKQIKFILNNAGVANMYLGNYDKALDYHYQSLLVREQEGDKSAISRALNNIGLVFFNLKDFERAIEYYTKAEQLSSEANFTEEQQRILVNLGLCYNQLGKYSEAITFFEKGFDLCGSKCNENVSKEGLQGLGQAFYQQEKYTKSKENFLASLEISKKHNDNRYTCENLYYLGKIEIELGNETKGISYLKEAEALAESSNLAESRLSIYKEFGNYFGNKKDYQRSLFYQNKYTLFKDSIFSEQLIKNLTKVQTNFDQRENIKTIAEKNQVVALQQEVITRTERQYIFIIAITCLIASLAAVLYYFTRRQQRINRQLSEAKNKIEEQNSQLAGYNRQLADKVAERTNDLNLSNKALRQVNEELDNFIYKTSHDIRGPLATLKGMCNVALMDVSDETAIGYLKKLDVTADRMNTILTRLMIVNQINSSVLLPVKINFQEILDEIFAFERKKGLPPRFIISCDLESDCAIISDVALVRIILENLIDNAIKFYNTSERLEPFAKIKLFKEGEMVKVSVEDNGIGMNQREGKDIFQMFMRASERSEIGGIGLYLAKLASEKIGGEVNLNHSGSKGSLFEVIFPLDLNVVIRSRSKGEDSLIALLEKQTAPDPSRSSTVI